MLNKLAHFYRESPLYFMEPAAQENRLVRKGCGEPIQLKSDPGLEMYSLIAMREHTMYPVLCVVEPGCGNLTPHTHNGEELIYMLSGRRGSAPQRRSALYPASRRYVFLPGLRCP